MTSVVKENYFYFKFSQCKLLR